jgi:dienelactone hydrolase
VIELLEIWHDPARGRDLPVRLRLPAAAGPAPAVLLSHGLGGSRDGLGYLGRALAEAGFVAVHLQHPGTDASLWRGGDPALAGLALAAAARDPAQGATRLADAVFALDEILRRNAAGPGPLRGRVDPARLAATGHSFGAWTVQYLLGQRLPPPVAAAGRSLPKLPDPRLRAGILLSPVPPKLLPPEVAFAGMGQGPGPHPWLLHVTGTEDRGIIEGTTPEQREIPFRTIAGLPQLLAVLASAGHAAFADEPAAGARWADPTWHARTAALALLFLRAALLEDAAARAALRQGAPGLLDPPDRLEAKQLPG